jgi:alpha-tubulin suppressor-like RCC1 family protein
VAVTIPNIVQIAAAASDTYALTSSGQVYAWGLGEDGALGDGSIADSITTPVLVNLPVPIASLANPAPFLSEMAVGTNGAVYGWGHNEHDLLCVTGQDLTTPVQLPLSGVTAASGQGGHALYSEGGTLYACGKGAGGALGDGSNADAPSPVRVPLPGPVSSLETSWEGSGAVVNGVYYDWGYNPMGQLGDGKTVDSNVPVRVKLPAPVAQVFQGGDYAADGETMALLTNGHVYAWGTNTRGELDIGNRTNQLLPVAVPRLTGATEVVCGGQTCYALLAGHLEGFGSSANGVLQKDGRAFSYVTATSSNVAALR